MTLSPNENSCGAPTQAENIFNFLLEDTEITIPEVDLDDARFAISELRFPALDPIDIAQLTTKVVDGSGAFDIIMATFKAHLKDEHRANRLTGRDYAEAYVANTGAALGAAVQLLLGKDQAFYQAAAARAQARIAEAEVAKARIELETSKLQYALAKGQVQTVKADLALKKMQVAIADAEYCNQLQQKRLLAAQADAQEFTVASLLPQQLVLLTSQASIESYKLNQMMPEEKRVLVAQADNQEFTVAALMPEQLALLTAQVSQVGAQMDNVAADTAIKGYTLSDMLPQQKAQITAQKLNVEADTGIKGYTLTDLLPSQKALTVAQTSHTDAQKLNVDASTDERVYNVNQILPEQKSLVKYQWQAARAQTYNNHEGGEVDINGLIGMQKDLYAQQITSYQRDAEVKAAKIWSDAFSVLRSTDEDLPVPTQFNETNINEVLTRIKNLNDLNAV